MGRKTYQNLDELISDLESEPLVEEEDTGHLEDEDLELLHPQFGRPAKEDRDFKVKTPKAPPKKRKSRTAKK